MWGVLEQVDLGPGVRAGFTTRAAGNLARDVGDDPEQVTARRERLRTWAGAPIRFAHHVHGAVVLQPGPVVPAADPVGDGWCTTTVAPVAVHAADCLPVLLADPAARVVGAAHAGRRGLLERSAPTGGVLAATVAAMRARGAEQIRAVIGPSICGRCYEVPEHMARAAEAAGVPRARTRWGTPGLDLPAIALTHLTALGVAATVSAWCTLEDDRFFSHRAEATRRAGVPGGRPRGRHAGVVALID